ncbi:DegV family protein [Leuconostoc mesenteroides]|uniref:DegV family protein n=1 Tax=Leuconostoc mesenteroides TaxID=1245 RepID=UPI00235F31ED|nr:DegV family protein [Leuconostoc mesenteroides]
MSKIAVIIDSSSAMPVAIRNRYHIFQVNDPIIFGDEVYKETVDIHSLGELVKMMQEKKQLASTSQPAPGDWEEALNLAKASGYNQAILITLSSGISGTYQTANAIAQSYDGMDEVRAWDSKIAVMGAGVQAILAAAMAEKNRSLDEIITSLEQLRSTIDVRFVVNDISHLQRTGRLSRGQALIGGLLNIKPILSIDVQDEGKIGAVGKARKMSGALKEIKEPLRQSLAEADYPVRAYVIDGNNTKLGDKWLKDLQSEYPTVKLERGVIGAFIGVHTGDGAMGVIWARDWEDLI